MTPITLKNARTGLSAVVSEWVHTGGTTFVAALQNGGRTRKFKTLQGAFRFARRYVGSPVTTEDARKQVVAAILAGPAVPTPVTLDPFGMPVNEGDLAPWPPTDPAELAALDAWVDQMEREYFERHGNGDSE